MSQYFADTPLMDKSEMRLNSRCVLFTLCIGLTLCGVIRSPEPRQSVPAFPGAQGSGAYTPGGRGGRVLFVMTLKDYDTAKGEAVIAGSLRAACEAAGPRIVIFRVSGIIELKAPLMVRNPYLTLAGQTAPGGGVCLKNYAFWISGTHDVIVRYLRSRPGDQCGFEQDAITIASSCDVIVDHCSASWGSDEVLSTTGPRLGDVTVQWCMITESLDRSVHHKGEHGYGSLIRADGEVSFHHNVYAHHRTRCPRPGTYGKEPGILMDFRNNVIYNWIDTAGYSADDPVRMNYVANYIKAGPSTRHPLGVFKTGGRRTEMFFAGNVLDGHPQFNDDNIGFVQWSSSLSDAEKKRCIVDRPFVVSGVKTEPAKAAYQLVLEDAGASRPCRDGVDQRVINDIINGTGKIVNHPQEVGGWPEYASAEPPIDTDMDGMPDAWERQHGFDPLDPSDANEDKDGDGYTNIEEFINTSDPAKQDEQVMVW